MAAPDTSKDATPSAEQEEVIQRVLLTLKCRWAMVHIQEKEHYESYPDGCNRYDCPECKAITREKEQVQADWDAIQKSRK